MARVQTPTSSLLRQEPTCMRSIGFLLHLNGLIRSSDARLPVVYGFDGSNDLRLRYLAAMGIMSWAKRGSDAEMQAETDSAASGAYKLDWTALQSAVGACTACGLEKTRTQTVFGVGDFEAAWMLIGEAPGADEDRQGEPFVGRAGQLLNAMLRAVGLDRDDVYIANILKCRPPGNRDPLPEEVSLCLPYLRRQIELVVPRVIVALGRVAAQNLLGTSASLGRLRGTAHPLEDTGIPVVVTYHPAYLLRSPLQKRRAWDDLVLARSLANKGVSLAP